VEKWKQDRTDVSASDQHHGLPVVCPGPAFHGMMTKTNSRKDYFSTDFYSAIPITTCRVSSPIVSSPILHMSSTCPAYDVRPIYHLIYQVCPLQHPHAKAVQPSDDQGPS